MKENCEKKYLLPQRVSKTKVEVYEVTKEVYELESKEINRVRKQAQRNGECSCPKGKLWQCDGCCVDCPFYHKRPISLNDVAYRDDKGENDITYEDITPDENFENTPNGIMFKVLVEELQEKLESIDPDMKRIFDVIYEKTIDDEFNGFREIQRELDIPWTTFRRKLDVVKELVSKYFQ